MFFHPPKDLSTSVFARLPEEFRKAPPDNEWARYQPKGSPARSLLEGPSFDRNGNLWCVDLPNGRIYRITSDGQFRVAAEYDGWPNGMKIANDGRILVADYMHGIMQLDPNSCRMQKVLTSRNSESFRGCNDLHIANNGDIYFTDQGQTGLHDPTGRVYRYTAGGRLDCLIDTGISPNGLAEAVIALRGPVRVRREDAAAAQAEWESAHDPLARLAGDRPELMPRLARVRATGLDVSVASALAW